MRKPAVYELNGGMRFYSVPPPGSGHLLGLLIKVLDSYMYNASAILDENDNITFHQRFVEACKYVYAKRPELGDPDFESVMANVRWDFWRATLFCTLANDCHTCS